MKIFCTLNAINHFRKFQLFELGCIGNLYTYRFAVVLNVDCNDFHVENYTRRHSEKLYAFGKPKYYSFSDFIPLFYQAMALMFLTNGTITFSK